MRATEIAWAAGFFDGEGCTSVRTNEGRKNTVLIVTQCGPYGKVLCQRFKNTVGRGYINERGPDAKGKLRIYRWRCGSVNDVQATMKCLWPYLGPAKRVQFQRATQEVQNDKQENASQMDSARSTRSVARRGRR
jgi:hypothetical protein